MIAPAEIPERLLRFFATRPGVVLAYLCGSHAAGRAHRESDIDIGVLLDRERFPDADARFRARLELGADLIALLHCNDIDLVILNDAPPLFARQVVGSGVLVHCADPEAEHAYRRDVQLRAADLAPFVERGRRQLAERLGRWRSSSSGSRSSSRRLAHLRALRPRVRDAKQLEKDLSLQNDVLHCLQAVCQLVIDVAGELSTRRGMKFDDYTVAVRNLSAYPEVSADIVNELSLLPSFRNVLIHQYLEFDLSRAVEALGKLDRVDEFIRIVREIDSRS